MSISHRKTALILIPLILSIAVLIYAAGLSDRIKNFYNEGDYLFNKNFVIALDDADVERLDFLKDGLPTDRTLSLFYEAGEKFRMNSIDDLETYFKQVQGYFISRFDRSRGGMLFEFYKKHIECEMALSRSSLIKKRKESQLGALDYLRELYSFRIDKLGKPVTDALYGRDMKRREYAVRRSIIINDQKLYGAEKEKKLETLKLGMWGDIPIYHIEESNSFNSYYFKILLYNRDLSELGKSERDQRVKDYRRDFFTVEELKKLDEVDERLAGEERKIGEYKAAEQKILNSSLAGDEKEKKIRKLQQRFFGGEVEAFRRSQMAEAPL